MIASCPAKYRIHEQGHKNLYFLAKSKTSHGASDVNYKQDDNGTIYIYGK